MNSSFFDALHHGAIFFAMDENYGCGYAIQRSKRGINICCDLLPGEVFAGQDVNANARAFLSAKERLWIYVPEVRKEDGHPQIILWQMYKEPCWDAEKTGKAIYAQMQALEEAVQVIMTMAAEVFPAWRQEAGDEAAPRLDWQIISSHMEMGEA